MSELEQEIEKELNNEKPTTNNYPGTKCSPKKKRTTKSLTMSERMRIIDDFRNGIPDKYYSVSAHPKKAGEYIVRKRRNPLTYDIERPVKDAIINKRLSEPKPLCGERSFAPQAHIVGEANLLLTTLKNPLMNLLMTHHQIL